MMTQREKKKSATQPSKGLQLTMPDGNWSATKLESDALLTRNRQGASTLSKYRTTVLTHSLQQEDKSTSVHSNNMKERKKNLLMATLEDPILRSKALKWMCLPLGVFTVGIADALGATAVLDMQILTSSGDGMSSLYFALYNVGYLLGSLLTGFLFGKVNSYLLLSVAFVLSAAGTIASPYCSSLAVLCVVRCVAGGFLGVAFCAINAEHMNIWGNRGDMLLQFISGVYAVGGVVGPLVTSPFMADKETSDNSTISRSDSFFHNAFSVNTTNFSVTNLSITDMGNSTLPRTNEIHYAFLIGSVILFLVAIPPFVVFLLDRKKSATKDKADEVNTVNRHLPKGIHIFMATLLLLFSLAYAIAEISFDAFLTKFVVENFKEVTSQQGAYISTYFWASLAAAKFASMFTAKILNPATLLYIHFSILTAAYVGFLVSSMYSRINALTAFTCLMGIACSAITPAGFSWTEAELMRVTGPITAVITAGEALGSIINPFVVGQLMDHYSKMWFCYCEAVAIVLTLITFFALLTFNRSYVNKRYGKLREAPANHDQKNEHTPPQSSQRTKL